MIQIIVHLWKALLLLFLSKHGFFSSLYVYLEHGECHYFATQLSLENDSLFIFILIFVRHYLVSDVKLFIEYSFWYCIFQLAQNKAAWCICNEFPATAQVPFTLMSRSVCQLSPPVNVDVLLLLLLTFLPLASVFTVTTVTESSFVCKIKT